MNVKLLKIAVIFMIIALISVNILGCSSPENQTKTAFFMDTQIDISVYGLNKDQFDSLSEKMFDEMMEMENIFSRYISGSDINRINEAAGREAVKVNEETIFVLQKALEVAELSEGAFDPTIAPLLELWGFGTDENRVPTSEELRKVLPLINYRAVQVNEEDSTVFLPEAGMKIDLGGIAKGFIVDRGRLAAEKFPVTALFINAGGDISIKGTKPTGDRWRIAVQDPRSPEEWAAIIEMNEGSVATSGDYQRFFEEGGELFHHIIDPRTGFPAGNVSSVSIVAPDTLMSDALSTAVFVLGLEKGLELLESLDGVDGVIIDKQGKIHVTSGLVDDTEILLQGGGRG
ncbi:MAG: FAD:protein FMN transferase [Bacillota bacterium]|nr:FAD:protein FMN transferase [Bacillota bacterium]